jgi:chromosome condensin MukBEF complex kleisin-like MukF subunit
MATTSQVQATLNDVASLLDEADTRELDDDVRTEFDVLGAELARIDAAVVPTDADIATLQSLTDRARELLDQIGPDLIEPD